MKLRHVIAIVLTTALLTDSTMAAERHAPLMPTSKWQLDYAASECRLLRTFGDGDDQVTLQLGELDIADSMEMALAGHRIPNTDGNVPAKVSTSTVSAVLGMHAQGSAGSGAHPGIIRFQPDSDLAGALRSDAAAGQPTRLNLALAGRYAVQLDLGLMKGALAGLDSCMDDLIRNWGLDPRQQRQRKRLPEPVDSPTNWFRSNDYPASLNRSGIGALVVMRLLVAADGSVKKCAVSKAGGDKAFEDLTCQLATARARFRPAMGADGKPIDSVWIGRIKWQPGLPFVVGGG